MPRFAANLTTMYGELPFLDRFDAAAQDGFKAVEFQLPYYYPAGQVAERARKAGVDIVLFNAPYGDAAAGDRGIAALPDREAETARAVTQALDYARIVSCPRIHVLAGVTADIDPARCRATFVANLRQAAERAAAQGVAIMIEPLNPRDNPGYYLNRQDHAHEIRKEVGAANFKVQMDFYHCQIVEGDLAAKLTRHIAHIGHIQVAGVPDRHEPDQGEVNFPYLFDLIDRLGYCGWIGAEYRPRSGTRDGLGWVKPYL